MFPFGVTFYPDQWPAETWEENFRRIKEAGFNIVRFGEMAWDWVEPSPGKFDFRGLDRAMGLCNKYGLKVLLGIPTSQVPPWFHRIYKNSRPVAQDGTLYPEFGPRPNICKDNPYYRKLASRLVSRLAARYRRHPALYLWQLDNEPVYPPLDHTTVNDFCHCEHSRKAFIAWAKKKYGSLHKLNEIWGAKFWTNTFSRFDDITTPKAGIWEAVSPHIFLDWTRFKTDRIAEWVSYLAKMVKSIDKNHKVGTNGFIGICTRVPDHSKIPENLDWYGLDAYPTGGGMSPEIYAFTLDLWRSFTRNSKAEFHITELQGGQNVRWGCPDYVAGPEIARWVKTALAHGAKAILFHAWRPPLFGAETGGFGILKTDGSPTKRLEVIEKLAKELRKSKDFDELSRVVESRKTSTISVESSKVGIAYLRSSEIQSYQEQGPPRGIAGQWIPVRTDIGLLHGLLSVQGAYIAASSGGKAPIDFIFEQDLESGKIPCASLLIPNPYLLSLRQYRNIKRWVQNGGTLIAEARFGLKDENGHLHLRPLLEDLIGAVYDHTEITKAGFLDVVAATFRSPKNGSLKAASTKKRIITKKLGKGKVIYANFSLFLEIKNGKKKWANVLRGLLAG